MKTKQFNLVVIVYACITLLCVACSSPKVYITGNVGVEIYNSEYVHLGTIKDGGRLKVKLSKKNYTPFYWHMRPIVLYMCLLHLTINIKVIVVEEYWAVLGYFQE